MKKLYIDFDGVVLDTITILYKDAKENGYDIHDTKFYENYNFKDMTVIICPKEISKTKMVHTEGAILVDDYAGNLREWEKEGGIPVRFSTKLNGKGYLVIDKLDELINMFGSVVCK